MPRLLLAYHFFHPDDVVSARIFSDFAVEQQSRGWQVSVVTSNRISGSRRFVAAFLHQTHRLRHRQL